VISLVDVRRAAETIEGVAHKTPVFTSRLLDEAAGGRLFFKCENFQRGGAFKFRGAYNKMAALSDHQLHAGVVAYSSGNHAQAVALAARMRGIRATILMPADTSEAKRDATLSYGAQIVTYDRYSEDRVALGEQMAAEQGLTLIPPYDDPMIMAGQGTVALELIEEVGDIDVLVVPVGGGGLISGCATAAKELCPSVNVVGVEPEDGNDTKQSLVSGERVRIDVPRTIADGLQAETPGRLTFEVVRARVDDIVLVSDAELVGAVAMLFTNMKMVVEPSGAAAVAALLAGRVDIGGKTAGVVISGGNIGIERFCRLFA